MNRKEDNSRNIITSVILAFLSVVAMHMSLAVITEEQILADMGAEKVHGFFRLLWDLKMSMGGYSVETLIVIALLAVFYYHMQKHVWEKGISRVVLSALFAFFQVFGTSFAATASWDMIFACGRNMVKAGIAFAGYFVLYNMMIKGILVFLRKYAKGICRQDVRKQEWFTANKKSIFAVAGLILLMWLPYFIASFPALSNWDFFDMLDSYYGRDTNSLRVVNLLDPDVTLNNNNPVLQCLMAVGFMKLGNLLGSPYIGIFLFVSIQAVLFALVLSYVIYFLAKQGIRKGVRIGILLLYGLLPVNANYAFATLKDTNFAFVMILYILLIIELVQDEKAFLASKKKCILLGALAFLMIMLRNNGLYVVAITSVVFLVAMRRQWKRLVLPLFMPVVLYIFISNVIYPALSIAPGSRAEAYSIPFQQTARLLKEHPDEVSDEDKALIEKVFYVTWEDIAQRYTPELSDPVKSRFDRKVTDEEMSEYFRMWFKYLLKYPEVYVQATMGNCYGYFYPEAKSWIRYGDIAPTGEPYGVKSPERLAVIRNEMTSMCYVFRNIPGVGMLISIGFYTWCLFLCIIILLHFKEKQGILMVVPILVLTLTAIAGPANTMMRYVYPMILSVPIYGILVCQRIAKGAGKGN